MTENIENSPLPLRVRTFLINSEDIESERIIDHNQHQDRVWLGKHCFWAFRNGRGVETEPLKF